MKIERVSENQLRLTFTCADLMEQDLNLEELLHPSEKTQRLFRDIMEQALEECDFINENTPLMVEAAPLGMDGIMIIVTKMDNTDKSDSFTDTLAAAKNMRNWKKKSLDMPEERKTASGHLLIFSFEALDDVIHACLCLAHVFHGDSSLHKKDARFFLVLQGDFHSGDELDEKLTHVLDEYGQKHVSTPLAKYYLLEHGETMIEKDAVAALANAFG